jgi:hypothetical protein
MALYWVFIILSFLLGCYSTLTTACSHLSITKGAGSLIFTNEKANEEPPSGKESKVSFASIWRIVFIAIRHAFLVWIASYSFSAAFSRAPLSDQFLSKKERAVFRSVPVGLHY